MTGLHFSPSHDGGFDTSILSLRIGSDEATAKDKESLTAVGYVMESKNLSGPPDNDTIQMCKQNLA